MSAKNSNKNNNNRSSSSTKVASSKHPNNCTCGGCGHSGFPLALYRDFRDIEKDVFTGILLLDSNDKAWKLHDPNYLDFKGGESTTELAGTGHEMTTIEFVLDLGQYEANPEARQIKNVKDLHGILKDFTVPPDDFEISSKDQERFHTVFPHGTKLAPTEKTPNIHLVPQIRTGDMVKVMAYKYVELMDREARERLWVQVMAVTNTGLLVGYMNNDMENPALTNVFRNGGNDIVPDPEYHIKAGDLVSFPVTCVFGVEHGENWGTYST